MTKKAKKAKGGHDRNDAEAPAEKMKRKEYERQMRILHGELVAMQEWVKDSGAKICIVFEGRDTAGKGGTIKRITERVSPRVFRIVALPTPTEREKSQMYVQRYVQHFPAAGAAEVLAGGQSRRADPAPGKPDQRPAESLEAVANGPEVLQPLV